MSVPHYDLIDDKTSSLENANEKSLSARRAAFFAAAAHTVAPKPLNDWEVRRLWEQEAHRASFVSQKVNDSASFVPRQIKKEGRVIFELQAGVLRAKYKAAGGAPQKGKAFESGWNDRPTSDDDLLSEYPRDFQSDKASKAHSPKGNKRKITEFSDSSRRSLLDKLMSIEPSAWYTAKMLTLTYHHEWPTPQGAKLHLRALLKRFERYIEKHNRKHIEAYQPSFFWRLEAKDRDSGERAGEVAPHFHCFLFGCPYVPQYKILQWWHEITGDRTITQVRIERLDNRRKAMNYVAAYTAKKVMIGGSKRSHKQTPEQKERALLDIALYLAGGGRFWGFEGGANLPFGQVHRYVIPFNNPSCRLFILACEERFEHLLNRWSVGFRIFDFDGSVLVDLLEYLRDLEGFRSKEVGKDVDFWADAYDYIDRTFPLGEVDFFAEDSHVLVWDQTKKEHKWIPKGK